MRVCRRLGLFSGAGACGRVEGDRELGREGSSLSPPFFPFLSGNVVTIGGTLRPLSLPCPPPSKVNHTNAPPQRRQRRHLLLLHPAHRAADTRPRATAEASASTRTRTGLRTSTGLGTGARTGGGARYGPGTFEDGCYVWGGASFSLLLPERVPSPSLVRSLAPDRVRVPSPFHCDWHGPSWKRERVGSSDGTRTKRRELGSKVSRSKTP